MYDFLLCFTDTMIQAHSHWYQHSYCHINLVAHKHSDDWLWVVMEINTLRIQTTEAHFWNYNGFFPQEFNTNYLVCDLLHSNMAY